MLLVRIVIKSAEFKFRAYADYPSLKLQQGPRGPESKNLKRH